MKSKNIYAVNIYRLLPGCILVLASLCSNGATHTIQEGDYAFTPSNITAVVGDTVIWSWTSGSHTTTSTTIPTNATAWDSPMNSTNTTFQYVVTLTGVYNFHCNIHPTMMYGSITVSTATEINAPVGAADVMIYPNPTTRRFEVMAPRQIRRMEIYDVLGNTIYSAEINSDMATIDLGSQANGIYFMRLQYDNRTEADMKKIILSN